jgi:hypothetical protein
VASAREPLGTVLGRRVSIAEDGCRRRDTWEVTPELVIELLRQSEVALSPDGSRIAFGVSASFREQGKLIETRLWTGGAAGGGRSCIGPTWSFCKT